LEEAAALEDSVAAAGSAVVAVDRAGKTTSSDAHARGKLEMDRRPARPMRTTFSMGKDKNKETAVLTGLIGLLFLFTMSVIVVSITSCGRDN
jgi:hypothetical protein